MVCNELREYLLRSVSRSSGHFASGLGTVEADGRPALCLQHPFDRLVWDVGHQAYPHKILTGTTGAHSHHSPERWPAPSPGGKRRVRRAQRGPLQHLHRGGARHGGGGRRAKGLAARWSRSSVMAPSPPAWPSKALNHAGDVHKDMLVVLNDNEMSISENVGP